MSTRREKKETKVEYRNILRDFYWLHKFVTLTADVMFVNGIPFLVTFSQNIRLITAKHVPTRTAGQLAKSLMKIVKLYATGDFIVNVALVDKEFDKIRDKVGLLKVNTTATKEHVVKIEQQLRLVKSVQDTQQR